MENVRHVLSTLTLMILINDVYQMPALSKNKFFKRMVPVRRVRNTLMQIMIRRNAFKILVLII